MKDKCTIKDVAALAGVSVGTVSMVLNGSDKLSRDMCRRVEEAVAKLDYHRNPHARSLGSQKSRTIGVVVTDLTNPFFGTIVNCLQSKINARNYDLLLGMTNNDIENEKKVVSRFTGGAVDGLIIVPAHDKRSDTAHIYDLIRRKIPYVYLTTYYAGTPGDCIMTDLAEGSYQLTNHLIATGHQDIAMVSGYRELILSSERIDGFMRACDEHGIMVNKSRIVETEPDFNGGREAFDRIMQHGKPDAIIAVNDIVAMGVMRRADEVGLHVPKELSVAGYDDLLFSSMLETPLTTVRQPIEEICGTAVDLLFQRLDTPEMEPQMIRLAPKLCIRSSTCHCSKQENMEE